MHRLDRSYLGTPAGLVATGDVDPETKMRITVVLRPQARMDIMAPRLSRAEFRARHATSQEVIDRIAAYARNSRLAVEAADGANHVVRLTGSFAAAQAAVDEVGIIEIATRFTATLTAATASSPAPSASLA